jgi:hypothetical protein
MRSVWIATIALAAIGIAASVSAQEKKAQEKKEGTFSGGYYSYGTAKATSVGEERLLVTWDENGLQLTDGFVDHTTLHCWGVEDYTNGSGQGHGYCVGVDPSGDQFSFNVGPDEKHTPGQKSWKGSSIFTTGTGKYRGIIGGSDYVVHSNEFRPMADGTYVNYVTFQGHYKLP